MPAHIKAALTATSLSIPIQRRKLALGTGRGSTSGSTARRGSRREARRAHRRLKISADIVGREARAETSSAIDARWLMAYSAALGEVSDRAAPALSGVLRMAGHARCCASATGLQALERAPGACAARPDHPPRARTHEVLTHFAARVVAARQRRPGAFVVFRLRGARRARRAGDHHRLRRALPRRGARGRRARDRAGRGPAAAPQAAASRSARSRSRPPRRTSTPNARASGTRSTPTATTRAPPACPASSCTAPRRWRCRFRRISFVRESRRAGAPRALPLRRHGADAELALTVHRCHAKARRLPSRRATSAARRSSSAAGSG